MDSGQCTAATTASLFCIRSLPAGQGRGLPDKMITLETPVTGMQ
jgi:hypothetical protein